MRSNRLLFKIATGSNRLIPCTPDRASTSGIQVFANDHSKTSDTSIEPRSNIPLVSLKLHEHLFGSGSATDEMKAQMIKEGDYVEEKLQLPELKANGNLMKHFMELGKEQFLIYQQQMNIAMAIEKLPPIPTNWVFKSGWTVYESSGSKSIQYPDEKLLFFDVEVCMRDGKLPTIAIAVSPTNWYSWCSERLVNNIEIPEFLYLNHMIPLENPKNRELEKLVIGHNIAYDRQFVREQYLQMESSMRFWCTMSMHISCAGMADHQRDLYDKGKLSKKDFITGNLIENGIYGIPTTKFQELIEKWKKKTCKNSLEELYKKYCAENTRPDKSYFLNKKLRDFFVKEDINAIRENLQELFNYCASDVHATFQVFQNLYPIFCQRFPHPITACGMMEMVNVYLPITGNWRRYFKKCENISSISKNQATKGLIKSAQKMIQDLCTEDTETGLQRYQLDPWMWMSDWSRLSKQPEWPIWYFNIFQKRAYALESLDIDKLNPDSVKLLCREIPRIFGLCYGPYPLFFKPGFGWGFLSAKYGIDSQKLPLIEEIIFNGSNAIKIPVRRIYELICENRLTKNDVITQSQKPACKLGIFDFYRLPHPNGRNMNVGTPFAKFNKMDFEEDVIYPTRFKNILKDFLQSRTTTRFWGNYRDRYQEQIVIWLNKSAEFGAIAPSVIPAGTITRRAVHKLWLTSANPKQDIVGSELKSMIQCSNDWFLVGADVDSQEQWIAALFGDSVHNNRRAGATPFSQMLLAGDKTEQTDLHSIVAKQVGISRDHAKVLNYARLYGSGISHAEQFLRQQGISTPIVKQLSKKLFETTKGKDAKYYTLTNIGAKFLIKYLLTKQNAKIEDYYMIIDGKHFIRTDIVKEFYEWLKKTNPIRQAIFLSKIPLKLYRNGFESHTFNFLSVRSSDLHPVTPILKCWLSSALEPFPNNGNFNKEVYLFNQIFKRTVINWFVQSSAVDFLHMLLVCMRWLCQIYDIQARFAISIHDEVRYIVTREDRYRCALALTLSNMYVRAAISEALGIKELPRSIAFFSQVDIDKVLRKEVSMKCQMPDGETIPQGEALDIEEIVKRTNGFLNKHN